jgi:hypothetical protein
MQAFRRLADLGATIVVIHHSGKGESSKDYRGSSDIKASIDVGYTLANIGGDPSRLDLLRLKAFKSRFSVQQETIFRSIGGQFKVDVQSPSQTTSQLLQQLLIAAPGTKAKELEDLAQARGLGRDRWRKFLKDGLASGEIQTTPGPFNTKFHSWVGADPQGTL